MPFLLAKKGNDLIGVFEGARGPVSKTLRFILDGNILAPHMFS